MSCVGVTVRVYDVIMKVECIVGFFQDFKRLGSFNEVVLVGSVVTASDKLVLNFLSVMFLATALDVTWLNTKHEGNADQYNQH